MTHDISSPTYLSCVNLIRMLEGKRDTTALDNFRERVAMHEGLSEIERSILYTHIRAAITTINPGTSRSYSTYNR
jgi:hypothetical protein